MEGQSARMRAIVKKKNKIGLRMDDVGEQIRKKVKARLKAWAHRLNGG